MPNLVPVRYGRMLVSPFTFYRGGALIMASDLAATPTTGVTVQACGDAHLSNFGLFGTPERQMIFDINDFDETLPGPWEWDVKRLAASFEIMGRDRGFARADRRAIVRAAVAEYRDRIRQAAGMGALDAWYDHLEAGMLLKLVRQEVRVKQVSKKEARAFERDVDKAQMRDNIRVFTKRASEVDGELRIVTDPPLIIPIEDLITPGSGWEDPVPRIKKLLSSYRRTLGQQHHPLEEYRYVHAAYKMVGVGSVGTRCYIVLMLGRDHNDPLFLQVKEAQSSVLERFAGASTYSHHGQRVVAGQRLMRPRPTSSWTGSASPGSTARPATSTCASSTTGRAARTPRACSCPAPPSTPACAARRWPGPTPAGGTGSPSPPISAREPASTGPSPTSRSPTPIRTRRTTRRSPRR